MARGKQDNTVFKGGEKKIIRQPRILYLENYSSYMKEKFRLFQMNKSPGSSL